MRRNRQDEMGAEVETETETESESEPGEAKSAVAIARQIITDIVTGALPPGHKLREVEVARQTRTSRTPVREAFRIMQSKGFVTYMPNRGVVVAKLKIDEVQELWDLRSILERAAAGRAARNIDPGRLARLWEVQKEMETLTPFDPISFSQLDAEIHGGIARASGNSRLAESIDELWRISALARVRSIFSPARALAACREHGDVLRALEAGDPFLAGRYMEIHFANSAACLVAELAARNQ